MEADYKNHSLKERQDEEDIPRFTEGELADIQEALQTTQPVLDALSESVRADLQSGAIASENELDKDALDEKWQSAVKQKQSESLSVLQAKGKKEWSLLQGLIGRFTQSRERMMKSKNPSLEDTAAYLRCCLYSFRTPDTEDIKRYITHILGSEESERGRDTEKGMLPGFSLAEALGQSKDPETVRRAREMLVKYGFSEKEADKYMRDCVHEVNAILNRYALAWVILPAEAHRIAALDCEKEKAMFCSGIIFLDLDGLKSFNDILKYAIGMEGGDFYLNKVCEVVQQGETTRYLKSLGVQIEAVRFGGDEFIVHIGAESSQGTLQKFGKDGINIGEAAIRGIKGKVQGYEAEIAGLDISALMDMETNKTDLEGKPMTVQRYVERELTAQYNKATASGKVLGFLQEVFTNYKLPTGASGGYAYFGEAPQESWGPYTGENSAEQLEQFLRVFVRELITIASSRADAVKSKRKSEREESGGQKETPEELKRQLKRRVDRWVGKRVEELSDAEWRIAELEDVQKRAKGGIAEILQSPFFRKP